MIFQSRINSVVILRFVIRFTALRSRFSRILLKDLKETEIKNFCNFFRLQKTSCAEVYAQLYVALDQKYVDEAQFKEITDDLEETGRIIGGLMKYLQRSEMRGSKFK